MKRNILVSFLFCLLIFPQVKAQDISLRFSVRYGFYNMGSLKEFQTNVSSSIYNIEAKPVQSFPSYFNYQFQVLRKINEKTSVGAILGFATTGGRNIISDYSGEIKIDEILDGYDFGFAFESYVFKGRIKNLLFTCQITFSYTIMKVEESVRIYDVSDSQTTEFSSIGLGIEPGFSYDILTVPILVKANLGFHANLSNDFHLKGKSDAILKNIYPNWTGLRLGLQFGYAF